MLLFAGASFWKWPDKARAAEAARDCVKLPKTCVNSETPQPSLWVSLIFLLSSHRVREGPGTEGVRRSSGGQSLWIENYHELKTNLSDRDLLKYFEDE